jgi:hypothetical protein
MWMFEQQQSVRLLAGQHGTLAGFLNIECSAVLDAAQLFDPESSP